MGTVKIDTHSKDRALDSKYVALDNAEGVKRLLRDYNALTQRRFAGDYAACDILIDMEHAINRAGLTTKQIRCIRLLYVDQYTQKEIAEILNVRQTHISRYVTVATTKIARVFEYWARHGEGYSISSQLNGE